MSQQSKLTECRVCRNSAVMKQYIDFEKTGHNKYTGKDIFLIYDHGTQDIHQNKKACTYGCNTIIVWDKDASKYRDLEGGLFHEIPCQGVERYVEMAERQRDFIDPLKRGQMITDREQQQQQSQTITIPELSKPTEEALNPIAAQLQASNPSETTKTINFMWNMIKEIDRKVDALVEMRKENKDFAEAVVASFNSIDEVLATILTKVEPNQFIKGSELLDQEDQDSH